ncbi:hypothetical protein ACFSTA_09680 [Ornithinibacillus salinisoli]|uniref:Uncharacterized protein n=1 Tax=Ornithinibacillus salinisoli TaxID=1848459 RepID=A0ABW4VXI3_9BACI
MKKTKWILILTFALLIMLITLIMLNKNNNSLQEMYIKNSIIDHLSQFSINIKSLNNELEDVISNERITLNKSEVLKTNVLQTSKHLNDFKNNYNEFIIDEEELILDASIPEYRLIEVQNNLHILNQKLVSKNYDQNIIHEISLEELELLKSSQTITSYYNGVMETLESKFISEKIKNKSDFKRSEPWLDFIKKLGNDIR